MHRILIFLGTAVARYQLLEHDFDDFKVSAMQRAIDPLPVLFDASNILRRDFAAGPVTPTKPVSSSTKSLVAVTGAAPMGKKQQATSTSHSSSSDIFTTGALFTTHTAAIANNYTITAAGQLMPTPMSKHTTTTSSNDQFKIPVLVPTSTVFSSITQALPADTTGAAVKPEIVASPAQKTPSLPLKTGTSRNSAAQNNQISVTFFIIVCICIFIGFLLL